MTTVDRSLSSDLCCSFRVATRRHNYCDLSPIRAYLLYNDAPTSHKLRLSLAIHLIYRLLLSATPTNDLRYRALPGRHPFLCSNGRIGGSDSLVETGAGSAVTNVTLASAYLLNLV